MAFKIPDTPEELFKGKAEQFRKIQGFLPVFVVFIFLLVIGLTSFFTIKPDEVGIIRRFGKYYRTTYPGLQWKLPLQIDKLDKVKVTRVFKEEFGYRTVQPGQGTRTQYSSKEYEAESVMLTGDLNVLDVSWVVHFQIKDPVLLLFNIKNPLQNIRDLSESVMREVIGDRSVYEALGESKAEINLEAEQKLQKVLDQYESGILVKKIELQEVLPPGPVKPSFNEVNEAEQEKEKVINQSWAEYNRLIPRERGEAERLVREAEGYELARVNRAQGDAAKFMEVWNAYKSAKDVTRKRLYLESLMEVLPNAGKTFIFEPKANQVLPLLNLTGEGR